MKYAIMSDAHSNPAALKMALKDARRRRCGKFVFLGDVTGYGYDVRETLKLVKELFDVVIMGNHDSVCAGLEKDRYVQLNYHYDIDRAQGRELSSADLEWIRSLKYAYENEDFIAAHGDFVDPASWGYIFDAGEAWASFTACARDLMFCGHTHHVGIWAMKDHRLSCRYEDRFRVPAAKCESISFKLKPGTRYIVNVGSVGYPRNDFCCSYAVYDSVTRRITIRRLPFDFAGYVKSMLAAKIELPRWLEDLLIMAASNDRGGR